MTVTSTLNSDSYTATGGETSLAIQFNVQRTGDLLVYRTPSGGAPILLTYGSQYTIAPLGTPTCVVTLISAAVAGDIYQYRRVLPLLQDLDLRNQGTYLPDSMELGALDRIVEMIQQQQTDISDLSAGPGGGSFLFSTVPASGLPTASAGTAGKVYRIQDAGVQDRFVVTVTLSGGGYAWLNLPNSPVSSTDNTLARYDGATGALLQGSTVVVGDTGAVTGVSTISASGAISAASLSASGTSTLTGGVVGGIPRNVGTWSAFRGVVADATDSACTNGTAYVGSVFLIANATVTGIQYLVGSVGGTNNVIASLHNSTGTPVANSATAGVVVGTSGTIQQVGLTATYAAIGPAWYFIALTFNGTTAKFRTVPTLGNAGSGIVGNGVTQTFGTVAAFTAPTTFTADKVPVASLY